MIKSYKRRGPPLQRLLYGPDERNDEDPECERGDDDLSLIGGDGNRDCGDERNCNIED